MCIGNTDLNDGSPLCPPQANVAHGVRFQLEEIRLLRFNMCVTALAKVGASEATWLCRRKVNIRVRGKHLLIVRVPRGTIIEAV